MTRKDIAYQRLAELAARVDDGAYGTGDDLDTKSLGEDLDEMMEDIGAE